MAQLTKGELLQIFKRITDQIEELPDNDTLYTVGSFVDEGGYTDSPNSGFDLSYSLDLDNGTVIFCMENSGEYIGEDDNGDY